MDRKLVGPLRRTTATMEDVAQGEVAAPARSVARDIAEVQVTSGALNGQAAELRQEARSLNGAVEALRGQVGQFRVG